MDRWIRASRSVSLLVVSKYVGRRSRAGANVWYLDPLVAAEEASRGLVRKALTACPAGVETDTFEEAVVTTVPCRTWAPGGNLARHGWSLRHGATRPPANAGTGMRDADVRSLPFRTAPWTGFSNPPSIISEPAPESRSRRARDRLSEPRDGELIVTRQFLNPTYWLLRAQKPVSPCSSVTPRRRRRFESDQAGFDIVTTAMIHNPRYCRRLVHAAPAPRWRRTNLCLLAAFQWLDWFPRAT